MGTWGTGYFEDDHALDFMSEIETSANPKQIIKEALKLAIESDYLDGDDGTAAIISATFVDAQLNGTKFSPDDENPLYVDTFSFRNPSIILSDLKTDAVSALHKVLSDNSELNGLWAENEEDYPKWKNGIEKLISSLSN